MNTIKIAIRLPKNVANAIADDVCAADDIVDFFFCCVGHESAHVRRINGVPQYCIKGGVLYATVEDKEDANGLRARLLEGRPKYNGEHIIIDGRFLRALGFKESIPQFIEYAAVFGNQRRFWQQERLRACPRE